MSLAVENRLSAVVLVLGKAIVIQTAILRSMDRIIFLLSEMYFCIICILIQNKFLCECIFSKHLTASQGLLSTDTVFNYITCPYFD